MQPQKPSLILERKGGMGSLFLGGLEENADFYRDNEITTVVSICDSEPLRNGKYPARIINIPVDDSPNTNMLVLFPSILPFIDNTRRRGENIYINCRMGISRSATVVIAYLMTYYGMSLEGAYSYISRKRNIQPNIGFVQQLRLHEKKESTKKKIRRGYVSH